MAADECRACGHAPVAAGERTCPRCGADNPNPSRADRYAGRGMAFGAVLGAVAGACWTFDPAKPGAAIGGGIGYGLLGLFVGLAAGLAVAAGVFFIRGSPPPARRAGGRAPVPVYKVRMGRRRATVTFPAGRAASLPWVCAACGEPATGEDERKFSYSPPWALLLLLAGVGVLAALLLSRTATVALPTCGCGARRRRRAWAVFGAGCLVALAVGGAGYALLGTDPGTARQLFAAAGLGVLALGGLALVLGLDSVGVERIDSAGVTLKGLSPAFARALLPPPAPAGGRPPPPGRHVPAGFGMLDRARPWEVE